MISWLECSNCGFSFRETLKSLGSPIERLLTHQKNVHGRVPAWVCYDYDDPEDCPDGRG